MALNSPTKNTRLGVDARNKSRQDGDSSVTGEALNVENLASRSDPPWTLRHKGEAIVRYGGLRLLHSIALEDLAHRLAAKAWRVEAGQRD